MTTNIRNKSILVVDDDARMLRALDKVLTSEGMVVTCAEWAGDAIGILTEREIPIDMVITDLRMPFFSGLTTIYAIRKIFPELPIIVFTAFGSPDVRAECFRQGATAFLEKPLETQKLLKTIRSSFSSLENAVPAAESLAMEPPAIEPAKNPVVNLSEKTSRPETHGEKVQPKKGNVYEHYQ